MYFARWKRVDRHSLGTRRASRLLSFLIGGLAGVNLAIALLIVSTGSYSQHLTCEFDPSTQSKVAIFSVLDTLIGLLFLGIFLRPLCASADALQQNQGNVIGPDVAQTLKKIINANLAGALLSQCAQSTILVLTALTSDHVLVHAARLTTFANVLGISIMFRDTDKVFGKARKGGGAVAKWTKNSLDSASGKGRGRVAASYRDDSPPPGSTNMQQDATSLSKCRTRLQHGSGASYNPGDADSLRSPLA